MEKNWQKLSRDHNSLGRQQQLTFRLKRFKLEINIMRESHLLRKLVNRSIRSLLEFRPSLDLLDPRENCMPHKILSCQTKICFPYNTNSRFQQTNLNNLTQTRKSKVNLLQFKSNSAMILLIMNHKNWKLIWILTNRQHVMRRINNCNLKGISNKAWMICKAL